MKKFNSLNPSPDPSEGPGPSRENMSPQAKGLIIISLVGIVFAGALYWYTSRPSEAPLPPPPAQLKRPQPPQPKGQGPKVEVAPKVAKPAVIPRESFKPASIPAQVKKPAQKRIAKATEPKVKPEKRYRIQVASLVIERNALFLRNHLEKLGYTPVIRRTMAPITRHRVYVGEFGTREEAERTARRLNVDGFPSNLVQGGDGKFRLQVGSYYNLNKAIDLAHTLQEKKYTPKIDSKAVPTPVHQVRVGEYESRTEALKALEALKRQGFTPLIVRQ